MLVFCDIGFPPSHELFFAQGILQAINLVIFETALLLYPSHPTPIQTPDNVNHKPPTYISFLTASISAFKASYSAILRFKNAPVSCAFWAIPPGVKM